MGIQIAFITLDGFLKYIESKDFLNRLTFAWINHHRLGDSDYMN